VFLSRAIFDNARRLRQSMGDAVFFAELSSAGGRDDEWGDLGAKWDAPSRGAAMAAPPGHESHVRLVGDLVSTVLSAYRAVAMWHGDIGDGGRTRILADPPDVLLTTPESLELMLISPRVEHEALFAGVRAVVVDEVHAFCGRRPRLALARGARARRTAGRARGAAVGALGHHWQSRRRAVVAGRHRRSLARGGGAWRGGCRAGRGHRGPARKAWLKKSRTRRARERTDAPPFVRCGARRIVYRRQDLDAWLARHLEAPWRQAGTHRPDGPFNEVTGRESTGGDAVPMSSSGDRQRKLSYCK
jgi:hypothetical protein